MAGDRLLIKGGRVFDGVSDDVIPQDVLVEGDRIVEVKPGIKADARVLDATGKWVTPGFIDMHVHLTGGQLGTLGWEVLPAIVGCGITTVRDLGAHWTIETLGVGADSRDLRQMALDVESGKVVGPTIIYSGPPLHQMDPRMFQNPMMVEAMKAASGDPGSKPIESPEEGRAVVKHLIEEQGARSIKLYETIREPVAAAILDAAANRAPVTGHLGLTSSKFAMRHGIGGVEHINQSPIRDLAPAHRRLDPDDCLFTPGYALTVLRAWADVDLNGPEVEDWLRTLVDTGSFMDPTVSVRSRDSVDDPRRRLFRTSFHPRNMKDGRGFAAAAAADSRVFAGSTVTARASGNQRGLIRAIYEAGGDLVVGTDLLPGQLAGYKYHSSMLALQNRGMRAIDILRAATSVSAKHLWLDDIGRIAVGKRADIAMFDTNPVADIANVESVSHVVKGGVLYESAKLLALAQLAAPAVLVGA